MSVKPVNVGSGEVGGVVCVVGVVGLVWVGDDVVVDPEPFGVLVLPPLLLVELVLAAEELLEPPELDELEVVPL